MDVLVIVLEKFRPYLKVKHIQCDLLLKYIKIRQDKPIVTGRGSRGSTSFSDEEGEIYQQLLELNKRGKQNDHTSLS